MKKEIKHYTTVCDICEEELHDSCIRKNDGSFQEPYFSLDDIDLCYICAGKLFAIQIGTKLSKEKLLEMIKKTKEIVNPSNGIELLIKTKVESEDITLTMPILSNDNQKPSGGFIGINQAESTYDTTQNIKDL